MKNLIILCLCFIGLHQLCGQDSIRAINIFKHEIANGQYTLDKSILEQKSYDLKDQIVLHLYYDSVPSIERYTRFYYKNDRLISKERNSRIHRVTEENGRFSVNRPRG